MIIDCHCHFDRMQNPQSFLYENELRGNYIIGMTNTPRHFQTGFPYVKSCRFIRLALGFHPQAIEEIYSQLSLFKELISNTSYIGEVGLDFNKYFINSKSIQLESFDYICACLSDQKKIISIHSRMAERGYKYIGEIQYIFTNFSLVYWPSWSYTTDNRIRRLFFYQRGYDSFGKRKKNHKPYST